MAIKTNEIIAEKKFDALIADVYPPAQTFGVEIKAAEGLLKRGTLLARGDDGLMSAMTTGGVANCVLAEDVDATNKAGAWAYRSGNFAIDKLITKANYVITEKDIEVLRDVNIILSGVQKY